MIDYFNQHFQMMSFAVGFMYCWIMWVMSGALAAYRTRTALRIAELNREAADLQVAAPPDARRGEQEEG